MTPRKPVVEIIDPMVVEILKKKTPAQRLAQAFDMWDLAVEMIDAVVRNDYPDCSLELVQRERWRRIRGCPYPGIQAS